MQEYNKYNDKELSALLKKGDHLAYTEIYNRYKAPLYVHAYNKLRNTEEARDLIQELFESLWYNRETLNLGGHLSGYLYTAVRNRVFRVIYRLGLNYAFLSSIRDSVNEGICVTDHLTRENQLQAIIDREINALPIKMRQIFLLSRKQNLSHREIADQLGIAEPTVKKQVNNALKILRTRLGLFKFLIFILIYR